MTKAEAVQAQIDKLNGWLGELNEHVDDRGRVARFDYSPELSAAMDLHGIDDPDTAQTVFAERVAVLSDVRDRL